MSGFICPRTDNDVDFTLPSLPVHSNFFLPFLSLTLSFCFLCAGQIRCQSEGASDVPFKTSLLLSLLFHSSCPFICLPLLHLWWIYSHSFPPLSFTISDLSHTHTYTRAHVSVHSSSIGTFSYEMNQLFVCQFFFFIILHTVICDHYGRLDLLAFWV